MAQQYVVVNQQHNSGLFCLGIVDDYDLLKAEVPFHPTYGFNTMLEYNLGRNISLREKYNLDKFEKED